MIVVIIVEEYAVGNSAMHVFYVNAKKCGPLSEARREARSVGPARGVVVVDTTYISAIGRSPIRSSGH